MTSPLEPIRALIADGEVPSRAGLRAALEEGGIDVVAEAGRADETVERARSAGPDVSLVADGLPGDPLEAVRGIVQHASESAVIVLADDPTEEEALAALMAGASGYVHREVDSERLPEVVRAVASGEVAVPRAVVGPLLRQLRIVRGSVRERLEAQRGARLTDREWEVLSLLDA